MDECAIYIPALALAELGEACHKDRATLKLPFEEWVRAAFNGLAGANTPGPSRRHGGHWRIDGYLSCTRTIHASQYFQRVQQRLSNRGALEVKHFQERRRVLAHGREVIGQQFQGIESLITRELLGVFNGRGERIPRQNGFDGGERIGLSGFRGNQRLADFGVKPYFVIDGPTIGGELPFMLVARSVEKDADEAIVQFQRFIGQRRQSTSKMATKVA